MKKLPLIALALIFLASSALANQPDPGKWQFVYTVAETDGAMVQVVKDERGVHIRIHSEAGDAARMTTKQATAVADAFKDAKKIDQELQAQARKKGRSSAPQKNVSAGGVTLVYVNSQVERQGRKTIVFVTTNQDPVPAKISVRAATDFSRALNDAVEMAPKIDKMINP